MVYQETGFWRMCGVVCSLWEERPLFHRHMRRDMLRLGMKWKGIIQTEQQYLLSTTVQVPFVRDKKKRSQLEAFLQTVARASWRGRRWRRSTCVGVILSCLYTKWSNRKLEMEAELQVSLYLQTLRIRVSKFQKIWNKVLETVNDVYCVESQYKLIHILGYTKMINFIVNGTCFNTIKFIIFSQFRVA
jgi:hypothetical protein